MAGTKDKLQKILSENRSLILGAQILLGFQYQAFFRPRFEELPSVSKHLELVALALLLATILCLIAPSPFHRISEGGEATVRQHTYTSAFLAVALAIFSVALGLDVLIVTERFLGFGFSISTGTAVTLAALALWFGVPWMIKREGSPPRGDDEKVPLKEKVSELLTESRIVLPGAQALLGFQLAAYLTEGFERLSETAKAVHTASLLAIAIAMLLLMAPAPFHRLGEQGENTERFDRIGTGLVLAALVPLALGLAGELFVGLEKVLHRPALAWAGAGTFVAAALILWFVVPLAARRKRAG